MILTRPGNKRRIAQSILPHFPEHDLYIELFFGAGGMFFSKPKARHNIVNDYDSEVYNLFKVIVDRKTELAEFWQIMPLHEDLWKYWKAYPESDPIRKAADGFWYKNIVSHIAFSSMDPARQGLETKLPYVDIAFL